VFSRMGTKRAIQKEKDLTIQKWGRKVQRRTVNGQYCKVISEEKGEIEMKIRH